MPYDALKNIFAYVFIAALVFGLAVSAESQRSRAADEISKLSAADKIAEAEALQQQDPDSAIVLIDMGMQELKASSPDSLLARAHYILGNAYYFKDYYNLAVRQYEEALGTPYTSSADAFRSRILNNLGVSHDLLRNHDEALVYYLEALELEKAAGSPSDIADVYNNISLVYYAIGQYEEALEALDQADALIHDEPESPLNGLILQNKGMVLNALGDYEPSMRFTKAAIQIFDAFDFHRNKLQATLNLAIDFIDRNDNLDEAKALISGAVQEAVEHDIPVQRAMMNIQLGRIALLEEDPATALTYLEAAAALFDSLEEPYMSFPLEIFELQVEAYARSGNVSGVTEAMDNYIYYTKERDLASRATAINELKTQLSYNEKLAEVQQKTIALEQQRRRNTLLFSLTIILLILLAGLFAGYRYREKKLEKIFQLNQQARKKLSLLERLTYSDLEEHSSKALQTHGHANSSSAAQKPRQGKQPDIPEQADIQLYNKVQQLMKSEQLYLKKGLSLTDLSERLGASGRAISASIRHFSGMSFNHFINEYRVRHAMEQLEDERQDYLSLDAIYTKCGFASKTTFYSAFDRVAGITPSQYRKVCRKQHSSGDS